MVNRLYEALAIERMIHPIAPPAAPVSLARPGLPAQRRLALIADSAAAIASGVPLCIHTPSSRSPCRRPVRSARAKSVVSGNAPAGAPLKSVGARIAAPAIADAAGGRRQEQERVHRRRIEGFCEAQEIGSRPLDPDRVGIEVKERRRSQL